jgi:hypothetical protein
MAQIDLKKVNEGLKARGKRGPQNVGKVPAELKDAALKVAKLKVQVAALERAVRHARGAKPTKKEFGK